MWFRKWYSKIVVYLLQGKELNADDRKELAKLLIDSLDVQQAHSKKQEDEHWGQSLNRLLDELGPIDMKYPEIEDPVEWLAQLRADEQKQRLDN